MTKNDDGQQNPAQPTGAGGYSQQPYDAGRTEDSQMPIVPVPSIPSPPQFAPPPPQHAPPNAVGYAPANDQQYIQPAADGFAGQQGYSAHPGYPALHGNQQDPGQSTQPPAAAHGGVGAPHRKSNVRRTLIITGASVVAVGLLAVVGSVVYNTMAEQRAPEHRVEAFLDNLVDGKVEAALSEAGIKVTDEDVLLTDKAYSAAGDTITGYSLKQAKTKDGKSTIAATLKTESGSFNQNFTLESMGKELLFFDMWHIDGLKLDSVDVSSVGAPSGASITLGGKTIDQQTDALRVFPGRYSADIVGTDMYTGASVTATVSGMGGGDPAEFSEANIELTDAGIAAVKTEVDAYLDACAATGVIAPPMCPFAAKLPDPTVVPSNVVWTIKSRPEIKVDAYSSSGWSMSSLTSGSADMTADMTSGSRSGTLYLPAPVEFKVIGSVTGFADGKATVTIIPWLFG